MTTVSEQKHTIRKENAGRRKLISLSQKQKLDLAITHTLLSLREWKVANVVCIYLAKPEEVETRRVVSLLLEKNKTVVIPKVTNNGLVLQRITSLNTVVTGAFGVDEPPSNSQMIAASDVDLFIVPGVAFDRNGHRLGWGKGYYDNLLKQVTVPRIGLAYSCQIVPHIPIEPYDILMTTVVTEKEIIQIV